MSTANGYKSSLPLNLKRGSKNTRRKTLKKKEITKTKLQPFSSSTFHPCKTSTQHQTITSLVFLETQCLNRLMPLRYLSKIEEPPRRCSNKKTTSKTPSPPHPASPNWVFTRRSIDICTRHHNNASQGNDAQKRRCCRHRHKVWKGFLLEHLPAVPPPHERCRNPSRGRWRPRWPPQTITGHEAIGLHDLSANTPQPPGQFYEAGSTASLSSRPERRRFAGIGLVCPRIPAARPSPAGKSHIRPLPPTTHCRRPEGQPPSSAASAAASCLCARASRWLRGPPNSGQGNARSGRCHP
jgi:hypothetical protein